MHIAGECTLLPQSDHPCVITDIASNYVPKDSADLSVWFSNQLAHLLSDSDASKPSTFSVVYLFWRAHSFFHHIYETVSIHRLYRVKAVPNPDGSSIECLQGRLQARNPEISPIKCIISTMKRELNGKIEEIQKELQFLHISPSSFDPKSKIHQQTSISPFDHGSLKLSLSSFSESIEPAPRKGWWSFINDDMSPESENTSTTHSIGMSPKMS